MVRIKKPIQRVSILNAQASWDCSVMCFLWICAADCPDHDILMANMLSDATIMINVPNMQTT